MDKDRNIWTLPSGERVYCIDLQLRWGLCTKDENERSKRLGHYGFISKVSVDSAMWLLPKGWY